MEIFTQRLHIHMYICMYFNNEFTLNINIQKQTVKCEYRATKLGYVGGKYIKGKSMKRV